MDVRDRSADGAEKVITFQEVKGSQATEESSGGTESSIRGAANGSSQKIT